jgi:hypothetical protein
MSTPFTTAAVAGHNGVSMSNEKDAVSLQDVKQQTLEALKRAIDAGDNDGAHCLAATYEALTHASTMDHAAVKAAAERALRQLEDARARASAGPNAAVPKSALETA